MNEYNNQFGLRDLFMNPTLEGIFPQFDRNENLQNVYSFAKTEERVKKYLINVLRASETEDGELAVRGKHYMILRRIQQLAPLIEGLFNDMPKIAKALRANTKLYLPYATIKQMADIRGRAAKQQALKLVLDNFQYNADFGALNSIKNQSPAMFARGKREWEMKVNYRRLRQI